MTVSRGQICVQYRVMTLLFECNGLAVVMGRQMITNVLFSVTFWLHKHLARKQLDSSASFTGHHLLILVIIMLFTWHNVISPDAFREPGTRNSPLQSKVA